MKCADCGKELCRDETGLSRKLLGRASRYCFCMDCLGRQFHLSTAQLKELAARFREAGCTLFR